MNQANHLNEFFGFEPEDASDTFKKAMCLDQVNVELSVSDCSIESVIPQVDENFVVQSGFAERTGEHPAGPDHLDRIVLPIDYILDRQFTFIDEKLQPVRYFRSTNTKCLQNQRIMSNDIVHMSGVISQESIFGDGTGFEIF